MIVNTELEQKGNLFPSKIINYKKDVDTLTFFYRKWGCSAGNRS